MKTKKCSDCKLAKGVKEFNRDSSTKGGLSYFCKPCASKRNAKNYLKKKLQPDWVEERRKKSREYARKNKDKRKYNKLTNQKYREKYPEKYKAEIVAREVKVPKGYQRHHWSYNECDYADVIPLTIKDHNLLHRYLVYNQKSMLYEDLEGNLLDTKEKHIDYYINIKLDGDKNKQTVGVS